ncbi:MAG: LamG domain-containing protein [Polyangiaceae bacterium]
MNQLRRANTIGLLLASTLAFAFACSKDDKNSNCDSGNCAGSGGEEGGKTAKGGSTSGGKSSRGGATQQGGTTAEGGTTSSESGGSGAQGGTTSSETTATGGTTAVGGASTVGGTTATGGTTAGGTTTLPPPPPGVAILKYDFEDGTGTTVTDTSGHSNTGTIAGATWTTNTEGRNGGAITFATKDDSVKVPANLFANATGLVVAAWVKLSANEAENRLFDFGSGVGNHIYLALKNTTGVMEFGAQLETGGNVVTTPATLPLNVWKHVAVVMGNEGTKIYVDGWQVAKNTSLKVAPSALGNATSSWIGKSQIPEHPNFAGQIDEFYVYDNPISLAEIRQLAWPKNDYSIWHFDEDLGEVAKDSSDFKRDATMVRATFNDGIVGNAAQLYNPSDLDSPPTNDQYVQLPEGVVKDCTQGYTIATWVKIAAPRKHSRVFEFSDNNTLGIFGRTMGGSTEQWAVYDATDGTLKSAVPAYYSSIYFKWSENLGKWYHVAVVREGNVLRTYKDGVQPPDAPDPTKTDTEVLLASNHPSASSMGSTLYNYIGRTRDSAASNELRRLHGNVDEFLLSCRPYTSDEIKLLAARP